MSVALRSPALDVPLTLLAVAYGCSCAFVMPYHQWNLLVTTPGGYRNRDFFVNSVNWLLGDVDAISIRPVAARASRLQLTTEQYMQIRYLALLVAPEVIAMLGIYAWWTRRRAPGR